ncbi:D-arabinono-1,4-lactone oxidase [Aquabacterium sp.]|uniref:D-arabinono-1,4-lactone oxidase n=1 Tax=Aquabacterium sp. TaxID=1872578 RepID=UPI0035AE9501
MTSRRHLLAGTAAALVAPLARPLPVPVSAAQPTPPARPPAVRQSWSNWSETERCTPAAWLTPADEAELADSLRHTSGPLRCTGAGHSFTGLVPTNGTLLSLHRLNGIVRHDATAQTVTVRAGTRLMMLSRELDALGLAQHNLPDIDMQSLAGALSTGTHGTGAQLPALHAHVSGLRLVSPSGQVLSCSTTERPELLAAAKVSLGSLGVITEYDLKVRPRYRLRRKVWVEKTESLIDRAPALAAQHRQFEMFVLPFTGYSAGITHDETDLPAQTERAATHDDDTLRDLAKLRDKLKNWPRVRHWLAQRLIDPDDPKLHEDTVDWSWKLLATTRPIRFNETEGHVPREAGVACLKDVVAAIERHHEAYFPIEFRYVKGDDAWLSPFHGRDSCSIAAHAAFGEPHDYLLTDLGPIYRRHGARPHWGKLHRYQAAELAAVYPRWKDFQALRRQLDPQGRLLNAHLSQLFGDTAHG